MKKVISLMLVTVLLLTFGLCGCGEKKDDANKDSTTTNSTTTTKSSTDLKDAVVPVESGKLIMATNAYFKPYEYYEGENIIGIDAEIAKAIAEKLGLELVIKDMQFDTIITAVNAGDADIGVAGMTVDPDRLKEVDFSISYASGVQVIIVKEDSPIKTVDDLSADGATYEIGVQLGTTGDIYCTDDFGESRVTQYANGNEAIVALMGGDVDCVIIDNEPAKAFVAANAGLKILDTSYADEDYAIAIKKGNNAMREAIDAAILELIQDGTIDTIMDKYIK